MFLRKQNGSCIRRLEMDGKENGQDRQDLEGVFTWVIDGYNDSITHYDKRLSHSRFLSKSLTITALASFSLTILWFPLYSLLGVDGIANLLPIKKAHVPHLGYVFAALAGVSLVIDKFGGYSKTLIRYSQTVATLRGNSEKYQAQFHLISEIEKRKDVIFNAVNKLWDVIDSETNEWAKTYSDDLNSLRAELNKGGHTLIAEKKRS